jgi:hypothetical protein
VERQQWHVSSVKLASCISVAPISQSDADLMDAVTFLMKRS